MAENVQELRKLIIDVSKRPDLEPHINTFIHLTERELDRVLVIRSNEESWNTFLKTDNSTVTLPPSYMRMRNLFILHKGNSHRLIGTSPHSLHVQNCKGMPRFYAVSSCIEFDRMPDRNYHLQARYYKKIQPLTDENPVNDVLTLFPDIYLHMSLYNLHIFARDEPTATFYKELGMSQVNQANIDTKRASHGPAPTMIPEGITP